MIQNTLYKGVKLARGLGMYPKRKWILIYACCLPLATLDLKRVSPLLTGAVRHFLPIHIRTHSIWGRKEQKKTSFSPGKRKKLFTHSHTIFPFTHRPVQVVCSPQSIIFTVVTDGRKAYCNYSYRYWGHLEVVSPHWKTELLELSKYSQKAVVNTQGGCKEATKWHICIVEKKKREREKANGKNITIIQLWDWIHVPTVLFLPCLFDVPFSSKSFCLMEEVIRKAMKGHIHHRSSDWCLSQACWWMYTHKHTCVHTHIAPDVESATPRGKPAMTSPRGVQVQGWDRKWVTGSLVRQSLPCQWQAVGEQGKGLWVTPRSWTVQGPQLADMLFTWTGISSPPSTIALIKILSK